MMASSLIPYLTAFLERPASRWEESGVASGASIAAPDAVLWGRQGVLRGDSHAVWARWFLEAATDPARLDREQPGYALLLSQLVPFAKRHLHEAPEDDVWQLAHHLARLALAESERRQRTRRARASREIRQTLVDVYGPTLRCWICGYAFADDVIDAFLDVVRQPSSQAEFVDLAKPSGLKERDRAIEVDHVVPVSQGGREGENLRACCGWCNLHKSDRTSMYDVSGESPKVFRHPKLGAMSLPQPFWVVRMLALVGRCEFSGAGGCPRNTSNAELTVQPRNEAGSMNPVNLQVVCVDHDQLGPDRLVARERYAGLCE